MPTYRPDPKAYLQLNQGPPPGPTPRIPDWQMGDDVPIDEGLPTNTPQPPTQQQPTDVESDYIDPNAPRNPRNPTIKTRIIKQGKRVYHQRYYELWQNGQYMGDVLIDPEPWLAEEPEPVEPEERPFGISQEDWDATEKDPELRARLRNWSQTQLTNPRQKPVIPIGPDMEWQWKRTQWQATQVEQEKEPAAKTKQITVGDNVWEYPTYKNPTTGQYEIDMSQTPTLVKSPGPKELAKKSSRTRQYQEVPNGPIMEVDEQQDPVTGKWTAVDTPRVSQPATPESESDKAQAAVLKARESRIAQAWALNPRNPEVAGRMSAYLKGNPMPQARILPDNGLDYGPQGGYTPESLPPSQILSGMLRAGGIGSRPQSYVDVVIGPNGEKTRVFEGTPQYNQAIAAGARPTAGAAPDAFVSELPWNEQQLRAFLSDPNKVAEYEAKGSQYGADWQRVDPETGEIRSTGELEKYLRSDVAYKAQAAYEQQGEQLSKDPAYMAGLVADAQARVSPYLREQESQKRSSIVSELRGSGRYR